MFVFFLSGDGVNDVLWPSYLNYHLHLFLGDSSSGSLKYKKVATPTTNTMVGYGLPLQGTSTLPPIQDSIFSATAGGEKCRQTIREKQTNNETKSSSTNINEKFMNGMIDEKCFVCLIFVWLLDFRGVGVNDVIVCDFSTGYYFQNDGDGHFTNVNSVLPTISPLQQLVPWLNPQTGRYDLLGPRYSSPTTVAYYKNTATVAGQVSFVTQSGGDNPFTSLATGGSEFQLTLGVNSVLDSVGVSHSIITRMTDLTGSGNSFQLASPPYQVTGTTAPFTVSDASALITSFPTITGVNAGRVTLADVTGDDKPDSKEQKRREKRLR